MKVTRGKSKRIDRLFAGVGRIALSAGTDHAGTVKRINAMLTGLYKIGRLDILGGIRDGLHKPLVVLHVYERGQLDTLPTAETAQLVVPAFRKFVASHECGPAQRRNMETTARYLEKLKGGSTATVQDLPRLLRELKDTMRDRAVSFNKARAHCLTFAGEAQGKMSPLWMDVMRVQRFKKAAGKRSTHRRPLTVAELDRVAGAFRDHFYKSGKSVRAIYGGYLTRMTYTLAFTGMRPSEYWERNAATWTEEAHHIAIHGTKTAAAKRPTFAVDIGITMRPSCGEQFFRRAFSAATEKALGVALDVYSLRRTFAALCESAQIEPSRARAYLGHGPATVTDLYLQTSVLPFVAADGEKLAAYIATERAKAKRTLKLETGNG